MTNIGVWQLHIYCRVPAYCVYVWVIVDFLLLSFKLTLGCLFSNKILFTRALLKVFEVLFLFSKTFLCLSLSLSTHTQKFFSFKKCGWKRNDSLNMRESRIYLVIGESRIHSSHLRPFLGGDVLPQGYQLPLSSNLGGPTLCMIEW